MRNRDIEKMLKKEFDSITPDVLSKIDVAQGNEIARDMQLSRKRTAFFVAIISVVLAIAIVLGMLPLWIRNVNPAGDVSLKDGGSVYIDINPSVQFTINNEKKVTAVYPLNSDAKVVINHLELIGKDIKIAMQDVMDNATKLGYIDVDGRKNAILISASLVESKKEKSLQKLLQTNLQNRLQDQGIYGVVITDSKKAPAKTEAKKIGITEAKMRLVMSAQKLGITVADPKAIPIGELNKLIENRIETLEKFEFFDDIEELYEQLDEDVENKLDEMIEKLERVFDDIEDAIQNQQDDNEQLKEIFKNLEEALEQLADIDQNESAEKYLNIIEQSIDKFKGIAIDEQLENKISALEKDVKQFTVEYANIQNDILAKKQEINDNYEKLLTKNENKVLTHKKDANYDKNIKKWVKENSKKYQNDWEGMKQQKTD